MYYYLTRNLDRHQRAELDTELNQPPPGDEPADEGDWSPEAEMAAFRQLQSQAG